MEIMDTGLERRLRAVMAEFELVTNDELGKICGAQASAVSNWLIKGNGPKVPQMVHLCKSTGLTLDWIYRGELATMDPKLALRLENRVASGRIKLKKPRNPRIRRT